jgi:DNA processing protein
MATAVTPGERLARATLTWLAEPGDACLNAFVRAHGATGAPDMIRSGRLPGEIGRPSTVSAARRAMERWHDQLREIPGAAQVAQAFGSGIRLICPGDSEWPTRLDDLGSARPYALWARGYANVGEACRQSVAIVGSRAATAYGSWVASDFGARLAERGWTIVSGAAYGVDAAAHRGALAGGGLTLAVLACGVDRPYPAGHKELLDAIAGSGAVVNEWPPGRNATRLRFLVRNRVIAAVASGILVVEAGERSGALNAARHARDLARPLMAVPGPITSQQSAGCHTIIRDWSGTLVTRPAHLIDAITAGRPVIDG